MKPRHLLLGAALTAAAGLAMFGDRSPSSEVVEPSARPAKPMAAVRTVAARPASKAVGTAILRLQPRDQLVGAADDSFDADGSDAFATRNWNPPPPPPQPAPPPPPPVAPPLPFTFIGKSVESGVWEVYLTRGERTFVVRDKDVVDGSYRVESIKPPIMTLTYLPLNQAQQLNIGVFD
jgi:hypothetical protein